MPSHTTPTHENETGLALGLSLIGVLLALLIALAFTVKFGPIQPWQPGFGSILLGIYNMAWGAMFLASYFFSHKSFFFRALIWFCEKSHPSSRKMAFFYFAIATLLGGISVLFTRQLRVASYLPFRPI